LPTNLLCVGTVAFSHGLNGRGMALSIHPIQRAMLGRSGVIALLAPCLLVSNGQKLPVSVVMNKHHGQWSRYVLTVKYILKTRVMSFRLHDFILLSSSGNRHRRLTVLNCTNREFYLYFNM
jgi:hypothetical protein